MLPEHTTSASTDQIAAIADWLGDGSEIRPVVWAPGYFVTSSGLVVSSRFFKLAGEVRHRILRTMRHSGGYQQVNLCVDKKGHIKKVHRLIAEAFLSPSTMDHREVRHLDGDPENNCLENLAWGTSAENSADQAIHGTDPKGERNGHAVVSEIDIPRIRELCRLGVSQAIVGRVFGVDRGTVCDIHRRRTWRHVP